MRKINLTTRLTDDELIKFEEISKELLGSVNLSHALRILIKKYYGQVHINKKTKKAGFIDEK